MINRYNGRTIDKQMNNDRMMEHQNAKDRVFKLQIDQNAQAQQIQLQDDNDRTMTQRHHQKE